VSKTFTFNWSNQGGWWFPQLGLSDNLVPTSDPTSILLSGPSAQLATGTPVNLTIHEPIQNVTIGSSRLFFHYSDGAGQLTGSVALTAMNENTSFILIPGLPQGGQLTFYLQAKDIFGVPISSGNYTYSESGTPTLAVPPGDSLLFIEAFDPSTGLLVPFLNVTIANSTWSEHIQGTPYGFAAPVPTAGPGYLYIGDGRYVISASAFGKTLTALPNIQTSPLSNPIIFLIPSGSIPAPTPAPLPAYSIPAAVGLGAAALTLLPVGRWYRERRTAAEAEQRRITL
jgi:hypothetical protein